MNRSASLLRTRRSTRLLALSSLLTFALGVACGAPSSDSAGRSNVRVLAKNVLLSVKREASIRAANAAPAALDANLVISANNVVYTRNANADLTAGDVQGALESLAVNVPAALPGTWSVKNVAATPGSGQQTTGKVRFTAASGSDELKVELLEGDLGAAGMTTARVAPSQPRTVSFPSPRVATFQFSTFMDETKGSTNREGAMALVVDARPDRIVLAGLGSPSAVAVLTREGPADAPDGG